MLTLCDGTTPVHLAGALDVPVLRDWITFHTGAPLVAAEQAQLRPGLLGRPGTPVDRFAVGLPDYPDRSATLDRRTALRWWLKGVRLTGPGIATEAALNLARNRRLPSQTGRCFPWDTIAISPAAASLAGLPRSTITGGV